MSKDTISVNMNIYDIPILVEQLEKANKENERLKEEYVMLQNASDEVEEEKNKEIERLKEENTILKQTMSNNSLLINENAFLKERIDKAIEYIEQHNDYFLLKREVKELLSILKEGEK